MTKAYHSLIGILLLTLILQEVHSSSLESLTNAFASRNDEVIIHKDSKGFYVEADLSYHANTTDNLAKMQISISSSETMLAYNCLAFDHYFCWEQDDCIQEGSYVFVLYPHFMTWGQPAIAPIFLDYSHWNIRTKVYLADFCNTNAQMNTGEGRGGIIGLGLVGEAKKSFIGSQVFSIYLNHDLSGGKLLWKFDPSLANSGKIVALETDDNWRVSLTQSSITVGLRTISLAGYSLIFDFHSDQIGFPFVVFAAVMQFFRQYSGSTCTSALYKPQCYFYGDIKTLPDFTFNFEGGSIRIPPEIYLEDGTTRYQDTITLNFKALDTTLTGENYVTPYFGNAIFLNSHFMKYYYTVFDASKKEIGIYLHGEQPSSTDLLYIIIGVVVLIVVIGVCALCSGKKKKPSDAYSAVRDHSDGLSNGSSHHQNSLMIQQK